MSKEVFGLSDEELNYNNPGIWGSIQLNRGFPLHFLFGSTTSPFLCYVFSLNYWLGGHLDKSSLPDLSVSVSQSKLVGWLVGCSVNYYKFLFGY